MQTYFSYPQNYDKIMTTQIKKEPPFRKHTNKYMKLYRGKECTRSRLQFLKGI